MLTQEFRCRYMNGNLLKRGNCLSNGKLDGKYETWYESGKIKEQEFYQNGKLNGERKFWHESGGLWEQAFYQDGKQIGEYKTWNNNGMLTTKNFYRDDNVIITLHNIWHPNGRLAQQDWRNETSSGHKEWNEYGQPIAYRFGQNGGEEEYKNWYENGQFQSCGFIRNKQKNGRRRIWYENGKLSAQEFYQDGMLQGEYKSWHENGTLQYIAYFMDGNRCVMFTQKNKNALMCMKSAFSRRAVSIINFHIISDLSKII